MLGPKEANALSSLNRRMTSNLWRNRDRFPLMSNAWFKAWAKRFLQSRQLAKQAWAHAILATRGAKIGNHSFLSDYRQISGHIRLLTIGQDTFIGRVELSVHAPLIIGNHVCINDGAKVLTASHDIRNPSWPTIAKPIIIEDYAWIATNSLILPGVTIQQGAVVAAGSVVTQDVPKGAVAAGNPAKIRESQRCPELNYSPVAALALFTAWQKLDPHAEGYQNLNSESV